MYMSSEMYTSNENCHSTMYIIVNPLEILLIKTLLFFNWNYSEKIESHSLLPKQRNFGRLITPLFSIFILFFLM